MEKHPHDSTRLEACWMGVFRQTTRSDIFPAVLLYPGARRKIESNLDGPLEINIQQHDTFTQALGDKDAEV